MYEGSEIKPVRLSQIAEEILDESNNVAVWLGPGHVQEFYRWGSKLYGY